MKACIFLFKSIKLSTIIPNLKPPNPDSKKNTRTLGTVCQPSKRCVYVHITRSFTDPLCSLGGMKSFNFASVMLMPLRRSSSPGAWSFPHPCPHLFSDILCKNDRKESGRGADWVKIKAAGTNRIKRGWAVGWRTGVALGFIDKKEVAGPLPPYWTVIQVVNFDLERVFSGMSLSTIEQAC